MWKPLVLTILALVTLTWAQTTVIAPESAADIDDATGTVYTIYFCENDARRDGVEFEISLFITTQEDRELTVEASLPLLSRFPKQSGTVRKGEVTELKFPQSIMHVGSSLATNAVKVIASGDIVVYGVNPQRFSSEGFIAIPDRLLGYEYFAVAVVPEWSFVQIGVVAVMPGTTQVNITMPNDPFLKVIFRARNYGANDVITVSMDQYQSLQIQHRFDDGPADLSGAKIQCSQHCSAFSGNARTSVDGKSRDLLVEQLPPVATWGKEFAVPPTPERTDRPDVLKIVCQQDGTTVKIDNEEKECDQGGRIQMDVSTDRAHYVRATKPIMCASIVKSQAGSTAEIQADPAMTLIIPEEQYAQTYTIATARWSGADGAEYTNYLSVVIRRGRVDSIILDGKNVNTEFPDTVWRIVPGTDEGGQEPLVTAYFQITPGTHTITTLNTDVTFMCVVYGAGDRESYAYMGGMRLKVINPPCTQSIGRPGDGIDNDCDANVDEELCDAKDDDGDDSIDEDCRISNAVKALGDQSIQETRSASLRWRYWAVDNDFSTLVLYKQQPGGPRLKFAQGDGGLVLVDPFDLDRYTLNVTEARRSGSLWIVDVTLNVESGQIVDTGSYDLVYTGNDGDYNDANLLRVQPRQQIFQFVATDLDTNSMQIARSDQPRPRNFFFTEMKKYKLTFQSFGGQHVDDLPYRIFFDGVEKTQNFEIIGVRPDILTGATPGLQEVRTAYELRYPNLEALPALDKVKFEARNNEARVRVDVIANVETLTRPTMECAAQDLPDHRYQVVCELGDVLIDLQSARWTLDGTEELAAWFSSQTFGQYTTSITNNNDGTMRAVLSGIRSSQWPSQLGTRSFSFSFVQTNGYSLSSSTDIILQSGQVNGDFVQLSGPVIMRAWIMDEGRPESNLYTWRIQLPDGSFKDVAPGQSGDGYSASAMVRNSDGRLGSTLTISYYFTSQRQFSFTASSRAVNSLNVAWSSSRDFTVQQHSRPVRSGTVDGETVAVSGRFSMTGFVATQGQPESNTYSWRIQLADGTFINTVPGQSGIGWTSTEVDIDDQGRPFSTVSVTYFFSTPRTFTFTASSTRGSTIDWTADFDFEITSNERLIQSATVEGTPSINGNTLTARAFLTSPGLPAANAFAWRIQLADGSFIDATPGQAGDGWRTSAIGFDAQGSPFSILTVTYFFSEPREFRFIASSVEDSDSLWSSSKTFTFDSNLRPAEPGSVGGEYSVDSNRVTIRMYVDGGYPAANQYMWRFQLSSGSFITASPGDAGDGWRASQVTTDSNGRPSATLTVSYFFSAPRFFRLTASSVEDSTTRWSSFNEIEVPSNERPSEQGSVGGEYSIDSNRVTIRMYVDGGYPAANQYVWRFQLSSGSFITANPGDAGDGWTASSVTTDSNGRSSLTLTVSYFFSAPRFFRLTASSVEDSTTRWSSFNEIEVPSNERPSEQGSVEGEYSVDSNQVTIRMYVDGGYPAANQYMWRFQLSSGSFITANPGDAGDGWTASSVTTDSNGRPSATLTVSYFFSAPRFFKFTASSVEDSTTKWSSFNEIEVPSNERPSDQGSVGGEYSIDSNRVTIRMYVDGGYPAANQYMWRFQLSSGSFITANPGDAGDGWTASSVTTDSNGRPSVTLTVSYFFSAPRFFRLTASSVEDSTTRWSSFNEIEVPSNERPSEQGSVGGEYTVDSNRVTIRMYVDGGYPAANQYMWRFQLSSGSFITANPGDAGDGWTASSVTTDTSGRSSVTLTVSYFFSAPRFFRFTASSVEDSTTRWSSFNEIEVPSNERPAEQGSVGGEYSIDSNRVTIRMYVDGGYPAANQYMWRFQLSSGSFITASPGDAGDGWRASPVTTDSNGRSSVTLTVSYFFSTPRFFKFTASSVVNSLTRWSSFNEIEVPSNERPTVTGRVEGESSREGTIITMTGFVSMSGNPAPNTFVWRIQLADGEYINAMPGATGEGWSTTRVSDNDSGQPSSTLTVTYLFTQRRDFEFIASSVEGTQTKWSSLFGFWFPSNQPPVQEPRLASRHEFKIGNAIVHMKILNAQPAPNDIRWELDFQDGTTTLFPGETYRYLTASESSNIDNGTRYHLNINNLDVLPRDVRFIVSYTDSDDEVIYRVSRSHPVPAPSQPIARCGLTQDVVRVGEVARLRCIINPNGVDLSDATFKFIAGPLELDGVDDPEGFTFEYSHDGEEYEYTLIFTVPQNFDRLLNFKFQIRDSAGTFESIIDLDGQLTERAPVVAEAQHVGVEGGTISLTCILPVDADDDDIVWERVSFGADRKEAVIYIRNRVRQGFANRYAVSKRRRDEWKENTLTITDAIVGDSARYRCRRDDMSAGLFSVDIISSTFMVNGEPFNPRTTQFNPSETYDLKFEFTTQFVSEFDIQHTGTSALSLYTPSSRRAERRDTFANQDYNVTIFTFRNTNFAARTYAIQTSFRFNRLLLPIATYVLTPASTGSSSVATVREVSINGRVIRPNQSFNIRRGQSFPINYEIRAPSCNDELVITIGGVDKTADFSRSTNDRQTYCLITYTLDDFTPSESNDGDLFKVVWRSQNRAVVIAENRLNLIGAPTQTTTAEPATGSQCGAGNGGCQHTCTLYGTERRCGCPAGLVLSPNGKNCNDVNECSDSPCGANEDCINSYGSFTCRRYCDCDCCDADEYAGVRRSKRDTNSVQQNGSSLDSEPKIFFPLTGSAVIGWLAALTAVCVFALLISVITGCRRTVESKLTA